MRRACIDIGSNTTRLLVADCDGNGSLLRCHEERAFTRIGSSLDSNGAIPEETIAGVAEAVAAQLASAHRLAAEEIICVATAGVRHARNGAELVERVTGACDGLPVSVLTGEQEARCAFTGAVWGMGEYAVEKTIAVVDVGGGSTEIAVGSPPDDVRWWVSLELGSAVLTGKELTADPPRAEQLSGARAWLASVFGALRPPAVDEVVAVGGSANSLRVFAGGTLNEETFGRALSLLAGLPALEIATRTGLDLARVRLLPAGILILEAVAGLFGGDLQIGSAGLREGLLLNGGVR